MTRIDRLDLLRVVCGELVVPDAVARKVRPSLPVLPGWISTIVVAFSLDPDLMVAGLDPSATAGLRVAQRGATQLVLLKNRHARSEADRRGMPLGGSTGTVGLAKEAGQAASSRQLLHALGDDGLFHSGRIVRYALLPLGDG